MKKLIALILFVLMHTSNVFAQSDIKYGQSFAPLVEKLIDGVVNISTNHNTKNEGAKPDIISANDYINEYFSQNDGGYTSLGSGFLIDPDGYIVTNNHVIEGASEIIVKTSDDSQYKAKLVGFDKLTDLALIKIDSDKEFPYVKIGNSDEVKVGDWILAIGNPFGLGNSVTAGIVSAKSRDIDAGLYDNFIQTDASINQGSSGGPMFNMAGEVVGINTALYSTSGTSMGIGFATPVNLSKFVINELKNKGKVERGWLGIKVIDNNQNISLSDNKIYKGGVIINSILPESPSFDAKLQAGQIILSINGKDIKDAKSFSQAVAESKIGSDLILRLWNNGQTEDITLKTAQMPDIKNKTENATADRSNFAPNGYIQNLGIIVKIEKSSVQIDDVLVDSDAYAKGLKANDIIQKINDKAIATVEDIEAYISYALKNKENTVKLDILSDGLPQTLNVRVQNNE